MPLDVIVIPVVFTLLFTYLFGGALTGSPHRYLQFHPPQHARHGRLARHHVCRDRPGHRPGEGHHRPVLCPAYWRLAPVTGALLGDIARYLLAAGLVVALGLAIGYRPDGGALGILAGIGLLLIFALTLSWAWTTLGLLLRTPQAVMSAATVVLLPLTLASNVFVAPHTMPGWLQALVSVNPVSHLVSAERALMAGHPAAGPMAWALLASAALAAVFAPVTAWLYGRPQ
jgi:daunorubicin/doxorubicin transport system permease protein